MADNPITVYWPEDNPPAPEQTVKATPAQQQAIACAGAGPLSDLAKQAINGLQLDNEQARCYGAGFVPDLFRMAKVPPGPYTVTYSADVQTIPNTFQPAIKLAAGDYPFFPLNSLVAFATTGVPQLDNAAEPFVINSVNPTDKTFTINTDLSAVAAPITVGRIGALAPVPTQYVGPTIWTEPPPSPEPEPYIPNGYEQAAADVAKAKEANNGR